MLIFENGWSDDGRLHDESRIEYIKAHLKEVLNANLNYGCNVKAYSGESFFY